MEVYCEPGSRSFRNCVFLYIGRARIAVVWAGVGRVASGLVSCHVIVVEHCMLEWPLKE